MSPSGWRATTIRPGFIFEPTRSPPLQDPFLTADKSKVFYSNDHVTHGFSAEPNPQEWVLIYLFYEIGVCAGDIIIE